MTPSLIDCRHSLSASGNSCPARRTSPSLPRGKSAPAAAPSLPASRASRELAFRPDPQAPRVAAACRPPPHLSSATRDSSQRPSQPSPSQHQQRIKRTHGPMRNPEPRAGWGARAPRRPSPATPCALAIESLSRPPSSARKRKRKRASSRARGAPASSLRPQAAPKLPSPRSHRTTLSLSPQPSPGVISTPAR